MPLIFVLLLVGGGCWLFVHAPIIFGLFLLLTLLFGLFGIAQGPRLKEKAQVRINALSAPIMTARHWDYVYWGLPKNYQDRVPDFFFGISFSDRTLGIGPPGNVVYYDFQRIVRAEIVQNHTQTITSSGGAVAIHGIAVGSGKVRTERFVNALAIKIVVDDPVDPIKLVPFFKAFGKGVSTKSGQLKGPIAKCEKAEALLASALSKRYSQVHGAA